MRSRALWWVATLLLGLVLAAPHALAQRFDFDFLQPQGDPHSDRGVYRVQWRDAYPQGIFNGCLYSITWYYATRPDGADRKRMVTNLRDNFSSFHQTWQPLGAPAAWEMATDPTDGRRYLRAPDALAGPAVSTNAVPGSAVLSTLVRPRGIQPELSLGLRVGPRGRPEIEVRHIQGSIQVVRGNDILATKLCPEIKPNAWYWYEFGVKVRNNGDMEARLRVYDEKHQKILLDFERIRPTGPRRVRLGPAGELMSISGPADFAEIYVDSWQARWGDAWPDHCEWDVSQVPDGSYYLIAEISDGKKTNFTRTSTFQVQVANQNRVAPE
jgi:hypothetical protein